LAVAAAEIFTFTVYVPFLSRNPKTLLLFLWTFYFLLVILKIGRLRNAVIRICLYYYSVRSGGFQYREQNVPITALPSCHIHQSFFVPKKETPTGTQAPMGAFMMIQFI